MSLFAIGEGLSDQAMLSHGFIIGPRYIVAL